jgi:hypothetical protein
MSPYGYEPKFQPRRGYDCSTLSNRREKSNVRFIGFLSAVPPGADAQDGGADSPNLTRFGHLVFLISVRLFTFLSRPEPRSGLE